MLAVPVIAGSSVGPFPTYPISKFLLLARKKARYGTMSRWTDEDRLQAWSRSVWLQFSSTMGVEIPFRLAGQNTHLSVFVSITAFPRLVLMVCCLALSPVGMGGYNCENSMLYTVRPIAFDPN